MHTPSSRTQADYTLCQFDLRLSVIFSESQLAGRAALLSSNSIFYKLQSRCAVSAMPASVQPIWAWLLVIMSICVSPSLPPRCFPQTPSVSTKFYGITVIALGCVFLTMILATIVSASIVLRRASLVTRLPRSYRLFVFRIRTRRRTRSRSLAIRRWALRCNRVSQ